MDKLSFGRISGLGARPDPGYTDRILNLTPGWLPDIRPAIRPDNRGTARLNNRSIPNMERRNESSCVAENDTPKLKRRISNPHHLHKTFQDLSEYFHDNASIVTMAVLLVGKS